MTGLPSSRQSVPALVERALVNVPVRRDRSQEGDPPGFPYSFEPRRSAMGGGIYVAMAEASWKRERMPSF
jgi:hypothetical protein